MLLEGRSLTPNNRVASFTAATITNGDTSTTNNNEEEVVSATTLRKDGEIDLRKNNRGSRGKRSTYIISKEKWDIIEDYEQWQSEQDNATLLTVYIKEKRLATKYKNFLSSKAPGWREPETREKILNAATNNLKKMLKIPVRARKYISKYPISHGAKVSCKFERKV